MKSRDFCFWLQGFFEITEGAGSGTTGFTPSQAEGGGHKRHRAAVLR